MSRKTVAVLATLAAALVLAVGAAAPGSAATAVARAVVLDDNDRMTNAPTAGMSVCTGGAQEQSIVRSSDVPFALAEVGGGLQPLPGATVVVNTPAGDDDQLVIIFSAEARLEGQPVTYTVPVDFLRVQILVDGMPVGANDLAFTTGAGESDATQACKRVSAPAAAGAAHTVSVQWMLVDQGMASVLTGVLDDWTLNVQVSA